MNPVKEIKDWFNSGVKFGYNTIKIGFKLALIYGTIWTVSQIGCNSCNKEEKMYKANCIENKIDFEYKINNNIKDKNIENYIIDFYK